MRKISYIILALTLSFVIFGLAKSALAATYYMPDNCANLQACFGKMSGGDTLIIRDGTYAGDSNRIMGTGSTYVPPSGTCTGTASNWCSTGSYTTVKAEHPGKVIIDGQNTRDTLCFSQVGPNPGIHHIIFDGLQFVNPGGYCGENDMSGASATNRSIHHMKFLRCGFQNGIGVAYMSYVLLEDVYVTGEGRYNIAVGIESDHVVVRRAVMRLDNGYSGQGFPIAHAVAYGADSVEWQNTISIDSDSQYYSIPGAANLVCGGIYVRGPHENNGTWVSSNNKFRGNILLNVHHLPSKYFYASVSYMLGNGASGLEFENGIYWDMKNINANESAGLSSNFTMNHMTFGASSNNDAPNAINGGNSYGDISDSLFYSIPGTAIYDAKSSNYNAFYGNGTDKYSVGSSANDIAGMNPRTNHLKYLPRIENYSGLDGNDGKKIGAQVICKYGADGTGWGEAGYNTLQSCTLGGTNSLWPFPYEDTIKTFFLNYGTGNGSPPNARGFCSGTSKDGSPQTLTKYIWEYLGNQIPADIYGGSTPTVVYGDVSSDGTVSAYDASLAAQYAVSLITLTSNQITAADVSGDGSVSAYDASLIAQKAVGLITKFPAEGG